jgi:hypothetical protein
MSTIKWISKAKKVSVADPIPSLPIWLAKTSSFSWSGVSSSYFWSFDLLIPSRLFLPMASTIMNPVPSMTFEPEIKKGLLFTPALKSSLWIWSVSPVIEDSSVDILLPLKMIPSTLMISPVST